MRVAVFTSGRQDWGILEPVCRAIAASPELTLLLIAGGMHCRDRNPTELDGLSVHAVVPALPREDDDRAVAKAAGDTLRMLADALRNVHAECVLILGDRTETLAAALTATCMRLPLVHLHGGEETAGAIDNACRHAITRLAHLHAVAHDACAKRLRTWGEQAERIIVSGAPALDALLHCELPTIHELEEKLQRDLGKPLIALCVHPTTLGGDPDKEARAVLEGTTSALVGCPDALVVMTRANVDAGGTRINNLLSAHAARDRRFISASDLGSRNWWSLMAHASVLVGNSSSGILEAPCFDLPVVNVGDRQLGRLRVGPCHDVAPEAWAVAAAVRTALEHPRPLPTAPHATAYGDGNAAQRIAAALVSFSREDHVTRLRKGTP